MKFRAFRYAAALGIVCSAILVLNGCSSSSANVITVTVTPPAIIVLAGQVQSFTATVGGSTTTTVTNWPCTYSYTPLPTTAVPNPKAVTGSCTSGSSLNGGTVGTWTITTTNGSNVLTYTAPPLSSFPNPSPTITLTAEADANKSKTGTATISLDSGIRVSVTPSSVTVPVGITPAQKISLSASFQNSPATGQQWKLVQPNSSSTTVADQTPNPLSDSCDPTCGTIDNNGIYTAPSTLPTNTKPTGSVSTPATTAYAVVWSSADTNHYSFANITMVNASTNPVTFNSVYPTTIPAGGVNQDIYLNAHNFLNTTNIYFTPPGGAPTLIPNTNIFTIPISLEYCTPSAAGVTPVVTCDASIMTRIRLTQDLITKAGTGQVTVTGIPCNPSSSNSCTVTTSSSCVETVDTGGSTASISCPVQLVYTNPALVAAVPDSFPQGTNTTLAVDGGYFGNTNSSIVKLLLDGTTDLVDQANSGPRRLSSTTSGSQIPTPGLFEVSVESDVPNALEPPFPNVITNIAVQPTFLDVSGIYHPTGGAPQPYPPNKPLPANSLPSSIALDSPKGFAVITEQGINQAQFIDLTSGTPTPSGTFATSHAPTSIAIDTQINLAGYPGQDLGIVVNSLDNTLTLYALNAPSSAALIGTVPVALATLIGQPGATGLPTPFSFGVDPGTHLGVVTYQNTNIAFIVDVNPNLNGSDTRACFLGGKPPCVVAPVSLVTGGSPQVVMQPNAPLAYVTPGGSGSTSVVDLLQQGTTAKIAPAVSNGTSGAVRTSGVVKIITLIPHGINPAFGGTVIVSGLTPTDLNGTFQVIPGSVIDPYTFSYSQQNAPDETETNTSSMLGQIQYGTPYYSFNTGAFATGAAINPVTRTFAWADYNSTSQQIGFIGTLDQNVSTLSLTAGSCQGCTPTPAGAPEIGFRSVAFDPYTDVVIAYNPSVNSGANFSDNAISLINPGGPGQATNLQPYRIIEAIGTGQVGTGSYTPQGQTAPLTVNGPMTYDPKTKNVLIANAGSSTLTYLNLDPNNMFKPISIQKLLIASAGVPNAQPQLASDGLYHPSACDPTNPTLTCMAQAVPLNQTATVKVFGQGFGTGAGAIVRLDAQPSTACGGSAAFCTTWISDSEVDVTIPASMLGVAHDYGLDVVASGVVSNSIDLYAVGVLDLTPACAPTASFPQGPEGVAIDETRKVAFVANYACNSVTAIAIDPVGYKKMDGSLAPYSSILNTVTVGPNPIGIATISRLGYTVVANSGDTPTGTVSIIDTSNPESMKVLSFNTTSGSTTTTTNKVAVGISPRGVVIDNDHAYALVANNGSNTVTSIDLTVLLNGAVTDTSPTPTTVAVSGAPTAVAVDTNRGIAVVTLLENSGTTAAIAGLDVINLTTQPPSRSTSASVSSLTASLTGIVFDQAEASSTSTTGSGSAALFYSTSTQQNAIFAFNPDSGATQTIRVGINPFGIAYNYNTGAIMTINSTSNTTSVIDSQTFKTRETQSISSFSQFPVATDIVNSISIIVDQNNNRVVFLPVPK